MRESIIWKRESDYWTEPEESPMKRWKILVFLINGLAKAENGDEETKEATSPKWKRRVVDVENTIGLFIFQTVPEKMNHRLVPARSKRRIWGKR